ncbi:MAG: 4-hydroxythreonine-4-phosphate dehydrogenase PdxA [Methylococcus sp.]
MTPDLILTTGEPGGIGPDLCLQLAAQGRLSHVVIAGDPELLELRSRRLGLSLEVDSWKPGETGSTKPNRVWVWPVARCLDPAPGTLNPANAAYVLEVLTAATDACLEGLFGAMVTGPVNKGNINAAGIPFTGHTEFIAGLTNGDPVMLLAAPGLRVALATTHLPLSQVPAAITHEGLSRTLRVLDRDLRSRFGISRPHILVAGLNPHAGENGHLGREEIDIIAPALDDLRREGLKLTGPLPADTLFLPPVLAEADAVLAMYHDQGLPVLKHLGFGRAVNVTLGLPIIRTSVDHGTALELAGTGQADTGSLLAAIELARTLAIAA